MFHPNHATPHPHLNISLPSVMPQEERALALWLRGLMELCIFPPRKTGYDTEHAPEDGSPGPHQASLPSGYSTPCSVRHGCHSSVSAQALLLRQKWLLASTRSGRAPHTAKSQAAEIALLSWKDQYNMHCVCMPHRCLYHGRALMKRSLRAWLRETHLAGVCPQGLRCACSWRCCTGTQPSGLRLSRPCAMHILWSRWTARPDWGVGLTGHSLDGVDWRATLLYRHSYSCIFVSVGSYLETSPSRSHSCSAFAAFARCMQYGVLAMCKPSAISSDVRRRD